MGKLSSDHGKSNNLLSMEKPVTTEELAKFTETEMLFHSNYIRLEVHLTNCNFVFKLNCVLKIFFIDNTKTLCSVSTNGIQKEMQPGFFFMTLSFKYTQIVHHKEVYSMSIS